MGEAPHTASPPSLEALPISKGRQGQGGALTPALNWFHTDAAGQWGGGGFVVKKNSCHLHVKKIFYFILFFFFFLILKYS